MTKCYSGKQEWCSESWCIRKGRCWAADQLDAGKAIVVKRDGKVRIDDIMKRLKITMYNDGENGGELFGFNIAGDNRAAIIQEGIEILELMKKREE